jgi:hypothetical protein
MLHVVPSVRASTQGDPAPIFTCSKRPRVVSRQNLEHLDHLREIELDFQRFLDGQTLGLTI